MDKFLSAYQVQQSSVFTHTSFSKTLKGSFYIPTEHMETFIELYKVALVNGENLSITEKHRDISPFLVDLDFRQKTSTRAYTFEHIKHFLELLKAQIIEYIDTTRGCLHDQLQFYVLEKLEPRLNKTNGFRDGIHIVCPNIVTKPELQYIIRKNMLQQSNPFSSCGYTNSYEDMYDEAVIEKNNWFLYGSKKPDEEYPWTLTKIYNANLEEIECEFADEELVDLLSIRNKFDMTPLKEDKIDEVKAYKKHCKEYNQKSLQVSQLSSDLDTIERLVMILNPKRADDYHMWITLGICLKSINNIYLFIWEEFSKQSSKYKNGECAKMWKTFTPKGVLTEGTLRFLAKQDNPEEYRKIQDNKLESLIYNSRNEAHFDIAQVVHFMFKDTFVCCYVGNTPVWYEFKNHRWHKDEVGASLRVKLSTEVFKKYSLVSSTFGMRAASTDDDSEQARFADVSKKLIVIANKLKLAQFKCNIMTECALLFKVSIDDFVEKLDSLHHIIGFDNGVYDLKEMRFRTGMPEDYVTCSVGYNFVDRNKEIEDDIMQFVTSIVSTVSVRDYLLGMLAYNLSGNKYLEQCWFLTGLGRNGKGSLMTLMAETLKKGKYYHEGDVAVLTNISKNANAATSALMALKGKRVAVFSESEDKDETIKVKILKQIVGRDLIQGREMYAKHNTEFRPTFSMIFCMNEMPKLSKLESNLVEKINVIRFPYRFCDNPQGENERLIDRSLKSKFEDDVRYRQSFMHILLEYYHRYGLNECNMLIAPEEVQVETKTYFDENNEVGMWLNEKCMMTNDKKDMMTPTEMYQLFKQDVPMTSITRASEFGKMMRFNNFKTSRSNGIEYYKGIKYNTQHIEEDDYDN
jgi:P4 family phage/plasmid primase-like protien